MEYPDYKTVKTEFELTHFKIMQPFGYCHYDKVNDKLTILSRDDLTKMYENKYFTKTSSKGEKISQMETKQFVVAWVKDSEIRTYRCLDFLPCQTAPKDVFNTWTGWKRPNVNRLN